MPVTVYRDYLDPGPTSEGLPGFLVRQTHLQKFVVETAWEKIGFEAVQREERRNLYCRVRQLK